MSQKSVLRVPGIVREHTDRHVPAAPAKPEQFDDNGRLVAYAKEARDAYDVVDLTILTEHGGFETVMLTSEAMTLLGGELPAVGETVNLPVRPYPRWVGTTPRTRRTVPGFSLAADVLVADQKKSGNTSRPLASAAS